MNEKEKIDFLYKTTGDIQHFSAFGRKVIEALYDSLTEDEEVDKDYLITGLRALDSLFRSCFVRASSIVFVNRKEFGEREEELKREGKKYDLKTRIWRDATEINKEINKKINKEIEEEMKIDEEINKEIEEAKNEKKI